MESNYFPSDIVIDILSRLPVETLLRFKSVSTNWDAMIIPTNPHLVSTHLKNYTNNPATKASLLATYLECADPDQDPRSVSLCPDDDEDGQPPTHMEQSLLERIICGTGNGLFLILDSPPTYRPHYRLWNPATRESGLLPDPPFATPRSETPFHLLHCSDYCGVGIDLAANDIKVVIIRNYAYYDALGYWIPSSSGLPSSVFVYTLRSNCWGGLAGGYPYEDWRRREPEQYLFNCHTYSGGFFYWLYKDYDIATYSGYVAAFDMGNNLFHKINCPPVVDRDPACNLGLYRDSVALFQGQLDYSSCNVWLLSGSDGEWGWIKHSSLGPFPESLIVKGCWKDDQFIAQTRRKDQLVLYDNGSKQIEVLVISKCWNLTGLNIYKPSLLSTLPVSLTSGKKRSEL